MDERLDYERTARRLNDIAADVVAVQEVDSMTQRTNNTYSPFIKALAEKFQICSSNELSYPADKPDECLDYIAVYKLTKNGEAAVTLNAHVVEDTITSDHRPIYADIMLPSITKQRLDTK